ncbi:MAG: hypothetical protein E7488_04030 [Ruminococcaceae bacterium]|nr:hypothetical protein [Oscillospiraceae bacterium]
MKITDFDINEYNVKSAPDTLKAEGNVTPRDIKHIFDRLPEFIVQKFNAFVDYVTGSFYTKEQTDSAISQKVTEIGAADMRKSVYDADNDGVVDSAMRAVSAENAYSLGGQPAEYYAGKTEVEAAQQTAQQACNAAETARAAVDSKADAGHIHSASTITAGIFTGDVAAYSINRATGCLRNIEVRTTDANGTVQSTNKIIMVRK